MALNHACLPVPDGLGSVLAARELGIEVILVGNETIVRPVLESQGHSGLPIRLVHAPEVVSMDDGRRVRYRGRPADARRPQAITEPYLKMTIDYLLAGRDPEIPETEPYG